ncbi:MAG: TRAM domain-containing protein [Deltaproteobacteria bacterium]|nr:TRAM domain-containing protein [Deltaproteobacteria bacterium]
MFQFTLKLLLIVACSVSGYFIASQNHAFPLSLLGIVVGLLVAFFVIKAEEAIRKLSLKIIFGGVIGLIVGLLIAYLFACGLKFIPGLENQKTLPWDYVYALLTFSLGYLGLVLGSKKSEEFTVSGFSSSQHKNGRGTVDYRILDTSVVIDGRIADICDTGFLEGNWIVPRFVLAELQQIADSSDPMKRSRGRRGLDILNRMQKSDGIRIDIVDNDFPKLKGVDEKLIALAKKKTGKIVTNDYNLNKVAELQGIKILNINELANALKPLVLPGEEIAVRVIKEGKEYGQGVAYLDDGTMVIVDHGSRHMGETLQVVVTSVLQTAAGRMIFASIKEEGGNSRRTEDHHH